MVGERVPGVPGSSGDSLPPSVLLDLCDGLLGEVGRRRHLFAWLRPTGAGAEEWLVVDSYYPANRLVVVCRQDPTEHDELYRALVPRHGLRLLMLRPGELGGDRAAARQKLAEMLCGRDPYPPPTSAPPPPPPAPKHDGHIPHLERESEAERWGRRAALEGALSRAAASLAEPTPPASPRAARSASQVAAVQRASRLAQTHPPRHSFHAQIHRPAPRPTRIAPARPRPRARQQSALPAARLLAGLALVALLAIEMYVDVTIVALAEGWVLLAFGIALDAVARALGTIAAARVRGRGWAWSCAVLGSPSVAAFALFQREGPVSTDPAPFAGLMSLFAVSVIAIGVLIAALNM